MKFNLFTTHKKKIATQLAATTRSSTLAFL